MKCNPDVIRLASLARAFSRRNESVIGEWLQDRGTSVVKAAVADAVIHATQRCFFEIYCKRIAHYTSIESALRITQAEAGLFFLATHCKLVNDKREGAFGAELLMERIPEFGESIQKDRDDRYIVSFSASIDHPNNWMLYGRSGQGVAIEFLASWGALAQDSVCVPVLYSKPEQTSFFDRIEASVNWLSKFPDAEDACRKLAMVATCLVKEDSFEFENEYRIVTFQGRPFVDYRNSGPLPVRQMLIDPGTQLRGSSWGSGKVNLMTKKVAKPDWKEGIAVRLGHSVTDDLRIAASIGFRGLNVLESTQEIRGR